MITRLKILSTPYYVRHTIPFDSKPVSITPQGEFQQSRPLMRSYLISFKASRPSGYNEVVIMDDKRVWLFNESTPPKKHFTIGTKVTPENMEQHILDLYSNGDKIKIEYENV